MWFVFSLQLVKFHTLNQNNIYTPLIRITFTHLSPEYFYTDLNNIPTLLVWITFTPKLLKIQSKVYKNSVAIISFLKAKQSYYNVSGKSIFTENTWMCTLLALSQADTKMKMYRIKAGLKLDHTLTILSHPHDTMIGLAVLGENRTHEAQSVWPSSWKSLDTKAQFLRIFDEI